MNIGDKYGRLTIIEGPFSMNGRRFKCQCECGHQPLVNVTQLRQRAERGGGCVKCYHSLRGHGYGSSSNPTYSKYQAMKQRCVNPKNKSYPNYGGRGIQVCDRWMNSFESFLADMGECPADDATIERKDSDGDYEPENCIWLSKAKQARNMRSNMKVEIDGMTFNTLIEACEHYGMNPGTVRQRLHYGFSIERALKEPVDKSKTPKKWRMS